MTNEEIINLFKSEMIHKFKVVYKESPFLFKIYLKNDLVYDYFKEEKKTVLDPVISVQVDDLKKESRIHHYNLMNTLRLFLIKPSEKHIRYTLFDFYRAYRKYKNKNLARKAYSEIYKREYKRILIKNQNLDLIIENERMIMNGNLNKGDYIRFNKSEFLITDNTAYLYLEDIPVLDINYREFDNKVKRIKMKNKTIKLIDKKWFYNSYEIKLNHVDLIGIFI